MSTTKKAAKTPNMEDHQAALQAMIVQGKKEGMIRLADLNALLEKMQLDADKIEKIYDQFDAMGIQIVTAELELDTEDALDVGDDIDRAKEYCKAKGKDLKIEVEVRNFDELNQVLALDGVHRVMLDNFNVENTRKAVEMVGGRIEVESSGGITFDTIRSYAECGVDYVSVGALTHSVKSLDMSFKAC